MIFLSGPGDTRQARAVVPAGRDDTTRYLCAAAHLDDDFADDAIREFLTEPTRAVPPTPGVRAGAVLAEAVAARARRKVRDALLVALFVAAFFTLSWPFLIGWVAVAVVLAFGAAALGGQAGGRADLLKRMLLAMAVLAAAVVVELAVARAMAPDPYDYYGVEASDETVSTVLLFLLLIALGAVLAVDEYVVWHHLQDRFGRGAAVADPAPERLALQDRPVYTFGSAPFLAELRRQLRGPEEQLAPPRNGEVPHVNGAELAAAPVVVARGYDMFVGAGVQHEPWSLAVPLEADEDADEVRPLAPGLLYGRITDEMRALRGAPNLSPGGRFAELRVTEQIVVAAEELVDHDDGTARDFLANRFVPPYPMVRGHRVRQLRDDPLEWARYYRCFQLETWDRDFVLSAYLHLAVDDSTLYLEWTPCVLMPIRARYRVIDTMSDSPMPPFWHALLRLITLPASLPVRLVRLCTRIRPTRRRRNVVSPDMFGVRYSLRELAADARVHNYFQLADRDRYLKMLESRLTLAITNVMREYGYSVASLQERVASVANNNVYITNGSFTGNMVTGRQNRGGAVTSSPSARGSS